MAKKKVTPLMQQYNTIKTKYPDAMLLFRVGDFYETFGKDAIKCSKILGIVLTKRSNGSDSENELAGFPHHSLNTYLPKLVRAGLRVAICDQLEDPKATKGIVKRGVTELVTPGVTLNDQVLNSKSNNFLASIHFNKNQLGISFLDISTGEFLVAEGNEEYILKLINGFHPSEILYQKQHKSRYEQLVGDRFYSFGLDDWVFQEDYAEEKLTQHFNTNTLKGFGIQDLNLGIIAAGAVLTYLADTHHEKSQHVSNIARIEEDRFIWMDGFTIRNLELLYSSNDQAVTLLDVIDKTISPMGGRMLKRWIALPLKDLSTIQQRHNIVAQFLNNEEKSYEIVTLIEQIADLERLVSKVATGRITPREVLILKQSLDVVPKLKEVLGFIKDESVTVLLDQLLSLDSLRQKIQEIVHEEAPHNISKGKVIAEGYNEELDNLRALAFSSKDYLEQIKEREAERTGIPSLKIAFNNVFGYYIEVRNTHKDKVPEEWVRKQTLVSAERYITEELKEYEAKILGAEGRIFELETAIFNELLNGLIEFIKPIQLNASIISQIDCLMSFAIAARENNYVKPVVNEGFDLIIKDGRHPVIEKQLPIGEPYIANDLTLNKTEQQMIMITGPNMSGKSALLRQTALIVLMAQIGSYVPAKNAEIGLVDKIFTRVGASDNISLGESTFMVEMNETSSILNNLSDRSLILLDEIGRGTSTYDGISIAWAISEYIHEHSTKARTLFATHYHELNEMTQSFPRIQNYNVSVKEIDHDIIFLRKLVKGGSNHSFGIHVAKMAGMPRFVIKRSEEILNTLEEKPSKGTVKEKTQKITEDNLQLSFFQLDDPILENIREEILNTDIDTLTPVEALMKLNEIKKMLGK
ncbi:DNA mismatch repair protein MutS [Flavobacteriaceae bacterium UJ101]|nr:DNA mismatch repair protein MutS [Flavobacteriaceae bacterium UJ101]